MSHTDELANLLKPILAINAEDKQKIKELTAENEELRRIADEYIRKCDKLTAELERSKNPFEESEDIK